MDMKYSREGLEMTKRAEGYRTVAYQDQGGVWTIGYGHTGPDVHRGLVWTPQQCEDALQRDLGNV